MPDSAYTKKPVSLDALLSANKEKFDKLFHRQMDETGSVSAKLLPPPREDLASESLSRDSLPQGEPLRGNINAELNKRFTDSWSSEIVEKKVENGRAIVRCRLDVEGVAKTEAGSSRIDGDEEAAFGRAFETALRRCAAQFPGDDTPSAVRVQLPSMARAGRDRSIEPIARHQTPHRGPLDVVTLELIENALRNARNEMDAVLFRSAMSPAIREQHDGFPMITDARGRMIVGQFGSYISEMLEERDFRFAPGDVILQSDPFKCGGATSHINDWIALIPVFHGVELIGFTSMIGHMMDVGGSVPGSMPTAATSIFGEGMRIPPIKIYEAGVLNESALELIMNNTRTPEMNRSYLMAIVAGCRAGERRIVEICDRFGKDLFAQTCEALLERTNRAMRALIVQNLPQEPQSFEDYVDDDGCGNGPFRMKLTVWREGDHAYFDWTGTAAQAPGPINFYLHEGMFKTFIGVYMNLVFDPQIPFNDGFHDLIHVTLPKGSILNPDFPAALGCRSHAHSRQFDVLGGALGRNAPETATAAGYGSKPYFLYSGVDNGGRPFQLVEILCGGIPGRPIGDGMDGHSWWPGFENIPTEYLESSFPLVIESYASIADSGGAGLYRGGNGIEKVYRLLEPGEVSIHDDRHSSQPWGILGGRPGACSEKWIERRDGSREALPSKIDNVHVEAGDQIIFRTAGGGGWGDPLERDPMRVRNDVARRLATAEAARDAYGVVLTGPRHELDLRATKELRETTKRSRKHLELFEYGNRL